MNYNLTFRGDISDEMRQRITRLIESKTGKVKGKDYEVLFLKDFVVGIKGLPSKPDLGGEYVFFI